MNPIKVKYSTLRTNPEYKKANPPDTVPRYLVEKGEGLLISTKILLHDDDGNCGLILKEDGTFQVIELKNLTAIQGDK